MKHKGFMPRQTGNVFHIKLRRKQVSGVKCYVPVLHDDGLQMTIQGTNFMNKFPLKRKILYSLAQKVYLATLANK